MAQSFTDPIGGDLYIPAAYPSITVAPVNGGLATTGVIVLMGEADSGPAFNEESDLGSNLYGADDIQSILAKYKSGPLVDAARAAAAAAVDPDITQPFSFAIPVKTNQGIKASSALQTDNGGNLAYGTLTAAAAGTLGNLIFYTITDSTLEVTPTTGLFSVIPPAAAINMEERANGGLATTLTIAQDALPSAIATSLGALLTVTGGTQRAGAVPAGTPNLTMTIGVPYVTTFTLSVNWVGVAVGDTIEIPVGSGFANAGGQNIGWYVVTSVAGGVVTATKAGDKSTTTSHVAGQVIAPVGITIRAVNVSHDVDLRVWAPMSIAWVGAATDGVGDSMEIAATSALAGDTDARKTFLALGTTAAGSLTGLGTAATASWLSVLGAPQVVVSAAEHAINFSINRKLDNITESYTVGGEVALKIGYTGYSCSVTIDSLAVTVAYKLTSGASITTIVMPYAQFPTIADVVAYLSSIGGFSASAGTAILGNLPTDALDANVWGPVNQTYSAGSTNGAQSCRIKIDAYRLVNALASSYLTVLTLAGTQLGGLPNQVLTSSFLSGGTKGGTTNTNVDSALSAMEQLRANFVIPCFAQDATLDKTLALTDPTSTYQIDYINSAVKTHVHKMSGMKTKRNRQAFLGKRDTFYNASNAAANLASHRCMMAFEDVKGAFSGAITQYQPYIAAAMAASMQAGAFYKSIVRKQVNVTGALQAAGDWTYNLDSNLEQALRAGLNPIRKAEEGGFVWVSDQTTYGKDNKNFYNSVQMVYAGDIVALTTAQRMEQAFVGESVADVTAPVAVSFLDSIMADFLRLKLIAPSDDAPLGYKNAKVVITGSTMRVSVEVKIAGSIYFIPIAFYITEITQSA